MAAPAVIIGGGLLLWALSKKSTGTTVAPTGQPQSTGTQSQSTQGNTNNSGTSAAVTAAINAAIGIGGAVIKGVSGGAGAVHAVTEATAAEAAGTGSGSVILDTIGGASFLIGIVIAIVVAQIDDALIAASTATRDFIRNLMPNPQYTAHDIFTKFTATVAQPQNSNGTVVRFTVPKETLRSVARAALYFAYVQANAYNQGLLNFYTWFGWQLDSTGKIAPSGNLYANYGSMLWAYGDYWTQFFQPALNRRDSSGNLTTTSLSYSVVSDAWRTTNAADFAYLSTPAGSVGELKADAIKCLGEHFWAVYNESAFLGSIGAISVMATAGWFGFYPGDEQFTRTIADRLGWSVVNGNYPVTNQPASATYAGSYNGWWLRDNGTGYMVAPEAIRGVGQLWLSTPASTGAVAGFGSYGGECALPDGTLVGCNDPRVQAQQHAAAQQRDDVRAQLKTSGGSGLPVYSGGSALLPLAVVAAGVGAFFLMRKKGGSAPALAGYSRRRRRRH